MPILYSETVPPQITRVSIRNFLSIEECDFPLAPLTFLVGRNGTGKSNILAALRFVSDFMRLPLSKIGGRKPAASFRIEIALNLNGGEYLYKLGVDPVFEELFEFADRPDGKSWTRQTRDTVLTTGAVSAAISRDQSALQAVSADPDWRPLHDALASIAVYDPHIDGSKSIVSPGSAKALSSDSSNMLGVLQWLHDSAPGTLRRIEDYVGAITPDIAGIQFDTHASGQVLMLFKMRTAQPAQYFSAESMSDGTLRSLALLTALFQPEPGVVCIEEPENYLHPRATHALLDALREATERRQVIVTTHSPELLDDKDLPPESILAVSMRQGRTEVSAVPESNRSAIEDGLFTAGELMRMNQLQRELIDDIA